MRFPFWHQNSILVSSTDVLIALRVWSICEHMVGVYMIAYGVVTAYDVWSWESVFESSMEWKRNTGFRRAVTDNFKKCHWTHTRILWWVAWIPLDTVPCAIRREYMNCRTSRLFRICRNIRIPRVGYSSSSEFLRGGWVTPSMWLSNPIVLGIRSRLRLGKRINGQGRKETVGAKFQGHPPSLIKERFFYFLLATKIHWTHYAVTEERRMEAECAFRSTLSCSAISLKETKYWKRYADTRRLLYKKPDILLK